MARIPDEEIERLKAEVSLQRLVEEKGIELRRHGADLIGLCPFHDDKEPSLVVTPKNNLWHCLGACQAGGSVIDWVMRAEGLSFRHAVELLRDNAHLSKLPPANKSTVPRLSSPVSVDVEDQQLLLQVVDYYHSTLKASPEALSYLQRRCIRNHEAIEQFRLGFANRTLGYRLPHKTRVVGQQMRSRLQRLGIYRDSGHEHFNGSLMIPVFDDEGKVTEIYGRKITTHLRKGTPDHLYLPGSHRGVFNLEALASSKEIILCESLIDALSFWAHGFRNVTASYGIEGFTNDHREAFERNGIRRVLIAYDHDQAGDTAAAKLSEELMGKGIECFRIVFPKDQDANDLATKSSNPQDALGRAIRGAVWIGKGNVTYRHAEPVELKAAREKTSPEPEQLFSLAAQDSPAPMVSPVPELQTVAAEPEVSGDELHMTIGDRRWRVRGIAKNSSFDILRVNVFVGALDAKGSTTDFHIDTLDLYSARARAIFTKQASEEIRIAEDIVKRDLGRVLLSVEAVAEELIKAALEPKEKPVQLSVDEEAEAMALLTSPNLLERILSDFERIGVVGERTNKLVGYLAAVSRKLSEPLAVVLQSASAAGKSSLMEAVLSLVPEEERVKFSAMTGQSLFYMGERDLSHKVLAIVEEEGAEKAAYALKLLQSEGELSIASTGKDPATGKLVTHEYRVAGPVSVFLTTTAAEIDEELLSRCIVLSVSEEREQTKAIHRLQRQAHTLAGLLDRQERDRILAVHRNAQRLLKPVLVANPYATHLTFADERTRNRRDHLKYLTLISAIALLHQHQREKKVAYRNGAEVTYIEVSLDDIRIANTLAHEVLGRSLDELSPQTRRVLHLVEEMVRKRCEELAIDRGEFRFSRKDVRRFSALSDFQVRTHLDRLVALEYLLVHRGGRGQSFVYELLYDGAGADGSPRLPGLIDVERLQALNNDAKLEGQIGEFEGGSRGQRGPIEVGSRSTTNGKRPAKKHSKPRASAKRTSEEITLPLVVRS